MDIKDLHPTVIDNCIQRNIEIIDDQIAEETEPHTLFDLGVLKQILLEKRDSINHQQRRGV